MATKKVVKTEETVEPKESKPRKTKKPDKGVVISDKLFVRKKPFSNSDIVGVLTKGTPVKIDFGIGITNFYKVESNGIVGYCVKDFISIE